MKKILLIALVTVGTAFTVNQILHNKNVHLTPVQENRLGVVQERLNAVVLAGGSDSQIEVAKANLDATERALALVAPSPAFAKR